MYGEARLLHIQHDFAVAQAKLRQQEMIVLGFQKSYKKAQDRLLKAYDSYRALSSDLKVGSLMSFVEIVPDTSNRRPAHDCTYLGVV